MIRRFYLLIAVLVLAGTCLYKRLVPGISSQAGCLTSSVKTDFYHGLLGGIGVYWECVKTSVRLSTMHLFELSGCGANLYLSLVA
jgi:phage shock protein PspC (stress-responsive transcriptional regulator)